MDEEEKLKKMIEEYDNTRLNSNYVSPKQKAIIIINRHLGNDLLDNKNTHFSGINEKPKIEVWWIDIPPEKFKNDLHLILKKKEDGFIWLKIRKGTFENPEKTFKVRTDKNVIELKISSSSRNNYLKDIRNFQILYNFRPHIQHEFTENI